MFIQGLALFKFYHTINDICQMDPIQFASIFAVSLKKHLINEHFIFYSTKYLFLL